VIVSNTTPLSNLLQLDLLDLPRKLFGTVVIPEGVAGELDDGFDFFGNWREKCLDFIQIVQAKPDLLIQQFSVSLHQGESEALAFAIRHSATVFLCDDFDARQFAYLHGLNVTGTLGILVKAKTLGLIDELTTYLDQLRKEIHFWFTDELYQQIQALANE